MWHWIEKERVLPVDGDKVLFAWKSGIYKNGVPVLTWKYRAMIMDEWCRKTRTFKSATHWARIDPPPLGLHGRKEERDGN